MIKKHSFYAVIFVIATAAISVAALLVWSRAWSHSPTASAPAAAPAETKRAAIEQTSSPHSSRGSQEGIKVHGRWTIDILDPDGKLVTHREFKNGLTTSGGANLGSFLQRTHKPGEWAIELYSGNNSLQPCRNDFQVPVRCLIYEPTSAVGVSHAYWNSRTLTIASETGNAANTVLTGTTTARRDGVIDTVSTILAACPVDTQGVCASLTVGGDFAASQFTRANLTTPIAVVVGQIIQVKVVISFS